MTTGVEVAYGLVLEDGRRWGEAATPHQRADMEAIFSPERPNLHFETRPRGGSKTTDVAAIVVAWLATEAPRMSRGRVIASSSEQASILIDAAAGFVDRTPELAGVLEIENERILNPATNAWVRVLSQSDSGSWGLRNVHLLVCDEFCQWPSTRGARRVWSAIRSTVPKVAGCRLVVLTSAGEPSHWSHEIYLQAKTDPLWRVSEMPGPVPWQDPEDLEGLRRELLPSEYERLVLNLWSEAEDHPISADDYADAAEPARHIGHGFRLCDPRPGVKYSMFVDVGLVNDATAVAVAHAEPLTADKTGPHRVVIDHIERRQGSRRRPVQLAELEQWIAETSALYNRAQVLSDPDQAAGLIQNLARRGIKAKAFDFTSASVGQIATALVQAFHNRQIVVPDNRPLRDELLRVRLRESATGVARLDHDRSGHDDQAVVIGMACMKLLASRFGPTEAFRDVMKQTKERREARDDAPYPSPRSSRALDREIRRLTRGRVPADSETPRCSRGCQHRWRVTADGAYCVIGGGTTRGPR